VWRSTPQYWHIAMPSGEGGNHPILLSGLSYRLIESSLSRLLVLEPICLTPPDQEFEMIRDPVAVSCVDGNIENWKNKQAFTSRWNVTLQ